MFQRITHLLLSHQFRQKMCHTLEKSKNPPPFTEHKINFSRRIRLSLATKSSMDIQEAWKRGIPRGISNFIPKKFLIIFSLALSQFLVLSSILQQSYPLNLLITLYLDIG